VSDIITNFTDGFTSMIEPFANGIKTGFTHLLYADPAAEVKVLSDIAQVGLIVGGAACAIGFIYGLFRLVKGLL